MDLSLIEKIGVIIKYTFSSFLSLEMFMLSFLLFLLLFINIKVKNKLIQISAFILYLGFIVGIFISYTSYVQTCIDSFVKEIMNYIYFPSTIVYFFIMTFVTIIMIYTLFSKKISLFKKIVNYSVFSILYFFFMSFLSLASYDMVDLLDITKLYENNTILSLVQVSNLLLFIWIIFTGFYYLYLYFKKKYD